jgi:chromosome condensin MukBEF MukE localization factor
MANEKAKRRKRIYLRVTLDTDDLDQVATLQDVANQIEDEYPQASVEFTTVNIPEGMMIPR